MHHISARKPPLFGQEARPRVFFTENGDVRSLRAIEGDLIRLAVVVYDGNLSEIARNLGISRTTLYRKMWELGITV